MRSIYCDFFPCYWPEIQIKTGNDPHRQQIISSALFWFIFVHCIRNDAALVVSLDFSHWFYSEYLTSFFSSHNAKWSYFRWSLSGRVGIIWIDLIRWKRESCRCARSRSADLETHIVAGRLRESESRHCCTFSGKMDLKIGLNSFRRAHEDGLI